MSNLNLVTVVCVCEGWDESVCVGGGAGEEEEEEPESWARAREEKESESWARIALELWASARGGDRWWWSRFEFKR